MTDKNGKNIKVGSVASLKKPGATNYTVTGKIVAIDEDIATIRCTKTGGLWKARMAEIRRKSYNPPKKKRWEGEV